MDETQKGPYGGTVSKIKVARIGHTGCVGGTVASTVAEEDRHVAQNRTARLVLYAIETFRLALVRLGGPLSLVEAVVLRSSSWAKRIRLLFFRFSSLLRIAMSSAEASMEEMEDSFVVSSSGTVFCFSVSLKSMAICGEVLLLRSSLRCLRRSALCRDVLGRCCLLCSARRFLRSRRTLSSDLRPRGWGDVRRPPSRSRSPSSRNGGAGAEMLLLLPDRCVPWEEGLCRSRSWTSLLDPVRS